MTEHPMITAARKAHHKAFWEDNSQLPMADALTAALQWMADPANLSDEVVIKALVCENHEDIEFAKRNFALLIQELRKEIEGHD